MSTLMEDAADLRRRDVEVRLAKAMADEMGHGDAAKCMAYARVAVRVMGESPAPAVHVPERAEVEAMLKAVEGVANAAYHRVSMVCCGKGGQECCGCPEPEWTDEDIAVMDALSPVQRGLSAMLAPAPATVATPSGWRPTINAETTGQPVPLMGGVWNNSQGPATVATEAVNHSAMKLRIHALEDGICSMMNMDKYEDRKWMVDSMLASRAPDFVATEAVAQPAKPMTWDEQMEALGELAEAHPVGGCALPRREPVAQGGGVDLACTNPALLGWGDARRVANALIEDGYVMRHELEEAVRCIAAVNKEQQP